MRPVLPVLLVVALVGPVTAQPRPVTPADYASVATVNEVAVSPDGKQVAYTLATWDKKADNRRSDLWVVATDGKGTPRRLTSDRANDRHPKWSADGKALYVLGNRKKDGQKEPPYNGSSQVWAVAVEEKAAPAAVTKVPGGVSGFDYSPKSDEVFYTADAEVTDTDPFLVLRVKYAKLDYGHGRRKVSEVFRIGKDRGKAEQVLADGRYVRDFAATADGKRLALITAPDDTVIRSEGDSRVDVWEADSGKTTPTDQSWRKGVGSPWPWLESIGWNPAGDKLAYCAIWDGYPAEVIVCEANGGAWGAKKTPRLSGSHVRGYGSPIVWRSADTFCYLGDMEGSNALVECRLSDPAHFRLTGSEALGVYAFDLLPSDDPDKECSKVAVLADGRGLSDLYRLDPDGHHLRNRLTTLNPQAQQWALPSVRPVYWESPDGTRVGGPLELPAGWQKGDKPLPLVVAIHGGPTTSSHAALEFDPHNGRLYLAAAGYAVLCPNYRGSTGYGDKFVTDLLGRENDIEVKDILAGIQHLIKEGVADPDRIGVMGWSNGGYLTNCLISMKDCPVKFKAACSGAGIVDTVAEWGFNDEPAYPRVLKTGLPWEKPEVYRKTSPTYQLGNVITPTLIHVGENDVRCPPGHSRMLYRALKEYVKVPTQLVVYPGEPHGLGKLSHRTAKMEWDLAWFDKYLKGK